MALAEYIMPQTLSCRSSARRSRCIVWQTWSVYFAGDKYAVADETNVQVGLDHLKELAAEEIQKQLSHECIVDELFSHFSAA